MRTRLSVRGAKILTVLALALGLLLVPLHDHAARAQLADGQPQKLESETLTVVTGQGRFELTVEIADEPAEQAIGLMHREEMPVKHGMLFDFGTTRPITMWMKNTPLSLDMIFIKKDGTVARIAERTTPFSLDTITSGEPVSYVLEVRGGVARLMGLKPGDKLEHRRFETAR